MRNTRRQALKLIGVAAGTALLASCGQAATPSPAATSTQAAGAAPQPTAKQGAEGLIPTAVPTKAVEATKVVAPSKITVDLSVPREETFVMVTGPADAIAVTDSFNYYSPRGIQTDWNLNATINEFILYHNIEGTSADQQWVNGLGEKYAYNPDFASWTITLRDVVK